MSELINRHANTLLAVTTCQRDKEYVLHQQLVRSEYVTTTFLPLRVRWHIPVPVLTLWPYQEGVHVHCCLDNSFQPPYVVSPRVGRWQSHTL